MEVSVEAQETNAKEQEAGGKEQEMFFEHKIDLTLNTEKHQHSKDILSAAFNDEYNEKKSKSNRSLQS